MRRLADLRRDTRGVAVTEFAIWVTLFFFGVMIALDFGDYYIKRGQVSDALSATSVTAFQTREAVNFSAIQTNVRNMAQNQAITVSIGCNGGTNNCTNTGRTCACLQANGSFTAKDCGSTCTGSGVTTNSTAGYYLTVTANRPYKPMILPDSLLDGANIVQKTTVRLQ